jgi:uncharacterized membrane protein (UPF0127 family)
MKNEKSKFLKIYIYFVICLLLIPSIIFGIIFIRRDIKHVCFSDTCFSVELAKTSAEQEKGLMGRTDLTVNKGMLFIFNSEDKYSFWMKDTKIELDIIWLDARGKVIKIQQAEPCKSSDCPNYTPDENAKYVLEINHGAASDVIKLGSVAKFLK